MTVSSKWKAESVFAACAVPNDRGPRVAPKNAKSRADLGLRENRYNVYLRLSPFAVQLKLP